MRSSKPWAEADLTARGRRITRQSTCTGDLLVAVNRALKATDAQPASSERPACTAPFAPHRLNDAGSEGWLRSPLGSARQGCEAERSGHDVDSTVEQRL
jgi:hypothetical protein